MACEQATWWGRMKRKKKNEESWGREKSRECQLKKLHQELKLLINTVLKNVCIVCFHNSYESRLMKQKKSEYRGFFGKSSMNKQ